MPDRKVIAIDGPAGSGKSTVARRLAARIGHRYLDSGAMYRALALLALRRGVSTEDEAGLVSLLAGARIELKSERVLLDEEDVTVEIRSPAVSRAVSRVATAAGVRAGMVARQRAAYPGEPLVVEGRDIGSVVFPDADVKVYLVADPRERARRRSADTGQSFAEVLAEQDERDSRDMLREHSPLIRAPGAIVLDTTGLGIDEVVETMAEWVERGRED